MRNSLWRSRGLDLREVLSAVGCQRRTGDEARIVGCEKHDGACDLVRFAEAANRDLRKNALLENVLGNSLDHFRCDVARADDVDRDTGAGAFLCERLREADVATFDAE